MRHEKGPYLDIRDWSWVDAAVISEDLEIGDFFLFDWAELPLDFCKRRVQPGTRY